MKTTILSFLVWYAITILLGYLILGKEILETRELVQFAIVVSLMTIFTPENNRKIWNSFFPRKGRS